MSQRWRILADDLTGALDTAAAFAGAGGVPVFLDLPTADTATVQAVSTGSRDLPHPLMTDALAACLPWFASAPDGTVCFKKVDSLLRGNSLEELAWLVRHAGFDGVVFAPAFPAQGRFTRGGRHWVGAPHRAGEPVNAIDVVAALAAVGLAARLGQSIDGMAAGAVLVPDVTTDADLAALADQAEAGRGGPRLLWCGSAGLAWALARRGGLAPSAPDPVRPGAVQLVTASRHPVLRAQLAGLANAPLPGVACADLAHPESLDAAAAASLLQRRCGELVGLPARPDHLVVVGGDTLLALCRAAGVHSLLAGAGPRSGWGRASLRGGAWHGVTCHARSGAFGAPDDLSLLLASLTAKEPVP